MGRVVNQLLDEFKTLHNLPFAVPALVDFNRALKENAPTLDEKDTGDEDRDSYSDHDQKRKGKRKHTQPSPQPPAQQLSISTQDLTARLSRLFDEAGVAFSSNRGYKRVENDQWSCSIPLVLPGPSLDSADVHTAAQSSAQPSRKLSAKAALEAILVNFGGLLESTAKQLQVILASSFGLCTTFDYSPVCRWTCGTSN